MKYRYTATHFQPRPYFGVGVQHQGPVVLHPEKKTRYEILQKDRWAPSVDLTGIEKRKPLTSTGVLTPNNPFRSQSLSWKLELFTLQDKRIGRKLWVRYHEI
jgi:hypothetical protein